MRQGLSLLLLLPILFSFLTTSGFAEEKTAAPLPADGGGEPSPATVPSTAGVYRLLRNAGAEIDRVSDALHAKPPDGALNAWRSAPAAETFFSMDFPKMALADTYHVLSAPARWEGKDWLMVAGAVAATASLSLLDQPLKDEMCRLQRRNDDEPAQQIRRFGGPYSLATLGLFYAGGTLFDTPKARNVAIDGAVATVVTSGIVVPVLKFSVGRSRPDGYDRTYHFEPFSGKGASFPSGESAQAFAVASVIATHYEQPWIKAASYGIASTVAFARLYLDGHFFSDVAAGALIGAVIGRTVASYNEKARANKEKKRSISIMPYYQGKGGGLVLTLS